MLVFGDNRNKKWHTCAILVFFCSNVNRCKIIAPTCSLKGSLNEWRTLVASPKLKKEQKINNKLRETK